MKYSFQILTIVNRGLAEKLAERTRLAGARGGTILRAKGSANAKILQLLALSDIEKEILITLVTKEELETIWDTIINAPIYRNKNEGIAYTIPLGGNMEAQKGLHELITVIVNRGYADEVMDVARKAGARGGSIVHARGTGKLDDEKFFGITIVPEKEEVLILAERENSESICQAISSLPCLTEPGSGILYTLPVERFTQLGKSTHVKK